MVTRAPGGHTSLEEDDAVELEAVFVFFFPAEEVEIGKQWFLSTGVWLRLT